MGAWGCKTFMKSCMRVLSSPEIGHLVGALYRTCFCTRPPSTSTAFLLSALTLAGIPALVVATSAVVVSPGLLVVATSAVVVPPELMH